MSTTGPIKMSAQLPGALHAGVKAHPKASPKAGPKRKKALMARGVFWKEIQREKKLDQLMEKYDESKTGNLLKEELANLLQDAAQGRKPTDEEVNFVLWSTTTGKTDRVSKQDIPKALDLWSDYERNLPEVEEKFDKYDANKSGKLERNQLKALLTDLDEGLAPSDDEVDWVMKTADGAVEGVDPTGGINKTELMLAVSLWYTHVEDKSSCCVVM
eukprot:CAMPEP_0196736282 /NCGR_PEP_ID=MMETSP1091-20130531/14401_1 /TAXON_ID=302021 /ORGANISM="Rhodomonas sp., Strain CCMP768" /LENGTH=214 /DNA_ID=CAMNT_0042079993 /DNA_START=98 /DNA_END=742 /DNA_ORIENTATION=+